MTEELKQAFRAGIATIIGSIGILLAVSSFALAASPYKDFIQTISSANYVVNGSCSGTLIDMEKGLILTAAHCVDNLRVVIEEEELQEDGTIKTVKRYQTKPLEVYQSTLNGNGNITGRVIHRAEVTKIDKKHDLALVTLNDATTVTGTATPVLVEGGPYVGQTVYAVGNPLGLEDTVTKGVVSYTKRELRFNHETLYTQYDGGIFFGNSGGGLFSREGDLIGVNVSIMAFGPAVAAHLGLAVDLDEIRKFLKIKPKPEEDEPDEDEGE